MINYQLTKTLRFGLTKVRKEKKHLSHEELDDLVMVSEERIKKEHPQGENQLDEQSFVKKIGECSKAIKDYLLSWGKVCRRIDKISVTKEFLNILARKTYFKFESKIENKITHRKTPLPSEVKLSGQKGDNYYDEPINEGISQYWQNTVSKALKLHSQLESMFSDYKKAIETEKHNQENPKGDNDPFDKLHLVDFRKMFLSVCSLVMDSLQPIVNERIIVSDNISKDEDKYILDFVNDKSKQLALFEKIEVLQNICKNNGGNIFFGKATLNKYTSEQAPNHRNDDINKVIQELKIEKFVSDFIGLGQDDINRKIYQSTQYSLENLNDRSISPIIRAQYFKYKTIPAFVRVELANYLNQQQGKKYSNRLNEIKNLFRIFGTSKSPALDYSNLKADEKTLFSLDKYPIKVAFDYAWEMCARSKYANKPVDFPKEICEQFLRKYFKFDSNEKNRIAFDIYAHILKINEGLSTLEHFENEPPKDINFIFRNDVEVYLEALDELCSINQRDKDSIKEWYREYKKRWEKSTEKGNFKELKKWLESKKDIVINFTKAKMRIGQLRGSQKSLVLKSYSHYSYGKIKGYNNYSTNSNVTEVFKDIASTFGKKFASIRDYFKEESEVNKIEYGAVIIQDKNDDKYLLLQKKHEGGINMPIFTTSSYDGDCNVYQVKSLTYKTVTKIYNSPKYPSFFEINGKKLISVVKKPLRFDDENTKADYIAAKFKSLQQCLTESDFMTNPEEKYLRRFDWSKEIDNCSNFDELEKIVNQKGYYLKRSKISREQIANLVNNQNCYLLPIVNQNITAQTVNDKNQFTKDWNRIFNDIERVYRLHPEFTMFYRYPTPDYPKSGEKRYSRFQMNVNFLMEYLPSNGEYISRKEQIETFNTPKKFDQDDNLIVNSQEYQVEKFNNKVNAKNAQYIIGIDRGINELATLCVIDSNGKIIGLDKNGNIKDEFDIYVKHFDKERKCWIHNIKPKTSADDKPRAILDLSNLRVETTIEGEQVLVDLSFNENGKPSQQIEHLKRLYYLRCISYLLQSSDYKSIVLEKLRDCNNMTDEAIYDVFKKDKFIDSYKGGVQYTDLPYNQIKTLISTYQDIDSSNLTESEKARELNTLCQLDASDSLKKGVVANMIGVVVYILKKLNYNAYISLENLCRAYGFSKDSLSGYAIESTNVNPDLDFKDQENAKLAGLGTYSFFEIQLLKKLFKLQIENNQELVPAFRSVNDYEKIVQFDNVGNKIYQFGIVYFVDPAYTSRSCPICGSRGKNNVDRKKHQANYDEDELVCKRCGFHSNLSHIDSNKNVIEDSFIKYYFDSHNYKAIISGDANAGFNIACRLGKNIHPAIAKGLENLHNIGKQYIVDNHFIKNIKINELLHLKDINIQIDEKHPHLIITGKNGSGKTILLSAIERQLREIEQNGANSDNNIVIDLVDNNYVNNKDFILAFYKAHREPKMIEPKSPTKPVLKDGNKMATHLSEQFLYFLSDLKIQESLARNEQQNKDANELAEWFVDFENLLKKIFDDDNLNLEFNYRDYSFNILSEGKRFKFTQLADGFAAILEIVADLILKMQGENSNSRRYRKKGIVLIDEIETHLHLKLQKDIMPLLTKVFPNIQFIVTTHSPFVLSSVNNAVAYDLEHKEILYDLNEYSYESLAEGYFRVDTESSYSQMQLNKFRELLEKQENSESEMVSIRQFADDFDKIPEPYFPTIVGQYMELAKKYANKIKEARK